MEWKDGEREGQRGVRDGPPLPETPTEPSPLTASIYFRSLGNFTFLTLLPLKPLTFDLFSLLLQFLFLPVFTIYDYFLTPISKYF